MTARLQTYWVVPPSEHGPLGIGVTAWSLDDAVAIMNSEGYGRWLPADRRDLVVTEGITVAELDQRHIVPNMGPIVVRGIWYPFTRIGLDR
jgi:hypothetical protein